MGNLIGGNSWCDPFHTFMNLSNFDPYLPLQYNITRDQIVGAEICMWSELVTPEALSTKIWPRANGFAEKVWNAEANVSQKDLVRRISKITKILKKQNIDVGAVTSEFCLNNIDHCFFE